jgi:plasmid stabilization system protein ParE
MSGYDFHPEAEIDLDAIWEFIAEDSQLAADRTIGAIEATVKALVPFLVKATAAPTSPRARCSSPMPGATLLRTRPSKKPLWVVAIMHGRRNPRVMAAILRGRE